MNEQDFNEEEILDETTEENTVSDKQRFDAEDEMEAGADFADGKSTQPPPPPPPKVKSMRETELENKLKAETTRREAAEGKLVGVQAKFEEIKTQMERETAEMRQRLKKTLGDQAKQEQFNFLTTLLPVLDNLNLAVSASEKDSSFEHLLEGVKGTARSFEQALLSVGVEPIAATGADFDPELHEAVDMVAVEPEDDDKITAEYARGYKFGDRLLRPAKVQVGKTKAQSAGE